MVTAAELTDILKTVTFAVPRLKDVPQYRGKLDSKPFEDVIEELNVLLNVYKITDEADKARMLATTMRGTALDTFNKVLAVWEKTDETYEDLTNRLAREFKPSGTASMFRRLLFDRRKKPEEDLEAYEKDLTTLAKRAFSKDDGFTEEQREKLLTDAFINGLPCNMQESLLRRNINSMKEALAAAQIEANIEASYKAATQDKIVAAIEKLCIEYQNQLSTNTGYQLANGVPLKADGYPAQINSFQHHHPITYQMNIPTHQWHQMNYVGYGNPMPADNGFDNFGDNNDNDDDYYNDNDDDDYYDDDNDHDYDDDNDYQDADDTNFDDDYGRDY